MKYTITEINPGQIKVQYENGSWAIVPIPPDATHNQIDIAVSKYDPEFLPKPETLINLNISVGEERSSKQDLTNQVSLTSTTPNNQHQFIPNRPSFLQRLSPTDIIQISEKLAQKGDTRIKDALESKINSIISNPEFSVDTIVSSIISTVVNNPDEDDIVALAEAELNAEQSGKQTGN